MNESGLVDCDSRPIAWREAGTGMPVVFLHGMPGSRTSWDEQLAALKHRFRCIAWDMPGYGGSDPLPVHSDFPELIARLRHFVTGVLGVSKAHLVGLSLGGMIALHAAARREDFVASLCILDCSPCFGFDGNSDPEAFVRSVLTGIRESVSVEAFAAGIVSGIVGPHCARNRLDAAVRSMSRASESGLEMAARLIACHDVRDGLGVISVPSLIMTGEQDVDTPPAYGRHIANSISGGRFVPVPSAGHLANVENPDFVNSQLTAFLSAL